jgi:hypothetical protein
MTDHPYGKTRKATKEQRRANKHYLHATPDQMWALTGKGFRINSRVLRVLPPR